MSKDVNLDIESALEAASEEPTEESSESGETEETVVESKSESSSKESTPSKEAPKSSGRGAQSRIQDLLSNSKELESQLTEMQSTLSARDEEIGKLVDLLQLRDNDAKIVAKINELHQSDPRFKDMIETLDKAIRGEEVKFDEEEKNGEKPKDDPVAKAQQILKEAQGQMEESLADQQADLIFHKADLLTDKYVEGLPESYNEEDVNILRTVLVDHINWDAIEENPDSLNEVFAEGFQSALDWYGTPKGAAKTTAESEDTNTNKSTYQPVTEERLKAYANQDWGKLKKVETPDGVSFTPEVAEEDFAKALGAAMKHENALSNQAR